LLPYPFVLLLNECLLL